MGAFFIIVLFVLSFTSTLCVNSVEKAWDDMIKDAISVDFSVYNRDEELFVNIINQDGYRICSANINRHSREQANCTLQKELLRDGDNTYFVTVYSLKNKTILQESVVHFFYDNIGKTWISSALRGAQNHILCTFRNGEECTSQVVQPRWRTTSSQIFSVAGILLAGAYATYSGPLKLAVGKGLVDNCFLRGKELLGLKGLNADGHDNSQCDVSPPPSLPSAPPPPTHSPHSTRGLLSGVRRNMHKFATARPTVCAAILLAVGVANRNRLPTQQAIKTQFSDLQHKIETRFYPGNEGNVAIEAPVDNVPSIVRQMEQHSSTHAEDVTPSAQINTPQWYGTVEEGTTATIATATAETLLSQSAPLPVTRSEPLHLAPLKRLVDVSSANFHAQSPARRQYLSRVLATGVVVSVHEATQLAQRLTAQDFLSACKEGLRNALQRLQRKPA